MSNIITEYVNQLFFEVVQNGTHFSHVRTGGAHFKTSTQCSIWQFAMGEGSDWSKFGCWNIFWPFWALQIHFRLLSKVIIFFFSNFAPKYVLNNRASPALRYIIRSLAVLLLIVYKNHIKKTDKIYLPQK